VAPASVNLHDRRKHRAAQACLSRSTEKGGRMQDKKHEQHTASRNEGEGNKTAAREYNEAQRRFVESGKVDEKARDAERSLDTEKGELKRAEAIGKRHAQGEDPAVTRKN
jgi:hypothetical protein